MVTRNVDTEGGGGGGGIMTRGMNFPRNCRLGNLVKLGQPIASRSYSPLIFRESHDKNNARRGKIQPIRLDRIIRAPRTDTLDTIDRIALLIASYQSNEANEHLGILSSFRLTDADVTVHVTVEREPGNRRERRGEKLQGFLLLKLGVPGIFHLISLCYAIMMLYL